jgi:hypothetical protein
MKNLRIILSLILTVIFAENASAKAGHATDDYMFVLALCTILLIIAGIFFLIQRFTKFIRHRKERHSNLDDAHNPKGLAHP